MLDESKNRLDEIADDLSEILSRITLQASVRRVLEKKLAENSTSEEKRCYAEDDEMPLHNDRDTFDLARAIGRVEGRLHKLLDNRLFEYSEDELHRYTHEQLFQKIQAAYEELRAIQVGLQNL